MGSVEVHHLEVTEKKGKRREERESKRRKRFGESETKGKQSMN